MFEKNKALKKKNIKKRNKTLIIIIIQKKKTRPKCGWMRSFFVFYAHLTRITNKRI